MIVGFAGAGNMARAMARGWAAGEGGPETMLFTDSGSGRAAALADELGGEVRSSLEELAAGADLVVLAVKPKALGEVAPQLQGSRQLVSVLAATTVETLRGAFPDAPVVRTMPNVAVEKRRGVICHAPVEGSLGPVLELLGVLGILVELPEELLDPATAVMGCSGAYFAHAAEAIAAAGADEGLDSELSHRLVAETVAGTGALLADHDAAELQREIASPGGSTEAGLEALVEGEAAGAFRAAVEASLERMRGQR